MGLNPFSGQAHQEARLYGGVAVRHNWQTQHLRGAIFTFPCFARQCRENSHARWESKSVNHHLTAYSLSKNAAKNDQNRFRIKQVIPKKGSESF